MVTGDLISCSSCSYRSENSFGTRLVFFCRTMLLWYLLLCRFLSWCFSLTGMIGKLSLNQQSDDMTVIKTVAEKIFSDGTTNWGRIASLVAFGAEVCKYLKETGREHCVKAVGKQISSYLLSEQRQWLLNNKAWVCTPYKHLLACFCNAQGVRP